MAISRQMEALREANLALQSQLEEAREEASRANKRVGPLVMAAQESKENEQAALKERDQMKQAYGSKLVRSARLQADKETLRAEMAALKAENDSLRDATLVAGMREDESLDLGYFTACYEATQGLPADLDLQGYLGWDRKLIQERASKFQNTGSSQEDSARRGDSLDLSSQRGPSFPDADPAVASKGPPNVPVTTSTQRRDPERATDIIQLEEDNVVVEP